MKKSLQLLSLILVLGIVFIKSDSFYALGQSTTLSSSNAYMLNKEIKDINNDIQDKKLDIKRLQQRQEKYTNAIKEKQGEKASLNNQLAILDNRLAKSELDLELTETEIDRIKLEIKKTDQQIEDKNKEIEIEKEKIANVLRLVNKKGNTSSLEILLLNESFSEFMSQVKYLEDMNSSIADALDHLEDLKKDLNRDKEDLNTQNNEFAKLKEDLEQKKDALKSEMDSKLLVVAQISTSEAEYQRLLALSKKEQENAAFEIASMEKQARLKLAALEGSKLNVSDNGFTWPVTKNVVTAYFHDPDYPFKHIFEHPGIDIRAGQGTTLKAAASGYVARAKNNGLGYSYIMLVHADGLSTVYGHVSKIYVKEDEYVVQGQTIGKTGGLPGTPGAGSLTTGPHLHFETRLNGIPVDPLSYLP